MKTRVLSHFKIDGCYGGNQQWMIDPWMHIGGCGALAAVDSCIYFAKYFGIKGLVDDIDHLDKKSYRQLGMNMKPYLRPRFSGINRPEIFTEGFERFLSSKKIRDISMTVCPSGRSREEAWEIYKKQIDRKILVPMLLLNPADHEWKDFHWHWFLLNGYRHEEKTGERLVRAVTYGSFVWKHWDTLWDEEHEDNGGMILYSVKQDQI